MIYTPLDGAMFIGVMYYDPPIIQIWIGQKISQEGNNGDFRRTNKGDSRS